MEKFKVGDRVRTSGPFTFDPTTGTIVKVYGDVSHTYHYMVKIDVVSNGNGIGNRPWTYLPHQIKLIETEWDE